MFTGINRVALRLVSSALLAAVLAHRGAEAAELKVCVDRNSPTAKVDAALARATARIQGTTAQIVGFDGGSDDDDDGLAPRVFRKLAATQCQLVLGFPLDAQSGAPPEGLRATQPYGRTGFVLVTRARTQASLDQLPRGSEVAVTYMTAPNLYFENHPALTPQVFTSDAASLRALRRGEVAAAMLWRPSVAAQLHGTLRMTALSEPHASWNLVALYAEDSQAVAQGFELAIAELRRSGRLAALLRPYADPAEAPAAHTAVVPESLVRRRTRSPRPRPCRRCTPRSRPRPASTCSSRTAPCATARSWKAGPDRLSRGRPSPARRRTSASATSSRSSR